MKGQGRTFDEMVEALRADPTADWVRDKGEPYDGRELRRLWDHAPSNPADKPKREIALVRFEDLQVNLDQLWLIEEILQTQQSSLVYGGWGTGKSF
jgi:hypothetical protein